MNAERERERERESNLLDFDDLTWSYLDGDGDFRSSEIRKLRDEADIIITNPPFSLFREFLAWIVEADKHFVILGNMNAITYKEVFPLIQANKLWLGASIHSGDREFRIPENSITRSPSRRTDAQGNVYLRVPGIRWFTNLDHGKRHEPLALMTESENIKFSKHKEVKGLGYQKYDNYDAIEIPFSDSIPSDHEGAMGVPISFLSKYNPEQFQILGCTESEGRGFSNGLWDPNSQVSQPLVDGSRIYKRIFIRHRKPKK